MIWLALVIAGYSLYSMFSSDSGVELALSLVRIAVSVVLLLAVRLESELMISAAVLLNAATILVGMMILRKEVQVVRDER